MPRVLTPLSQTPAAKALAELERRFDGLDRLALREAIAPVLGQLRSGVAPGQAGAIVTAAITACRHLYERGRSGEALPLASAALAGATAANDPLLMRRAAIVCGLVSADSADLVGAVEHYVLALRLANEARDDLAASKTWNNLGLAMAIAGHYELATRCFQRALAAVEHLPRPLYWRYLGYLNLANSLFQLGDFEQGLSCARLALAEQTEEFRDQDTNTAVILLRNVVRLLVATGRVAEAEPHVAGCVALAQRSPTPRALIAASIAQASHEMALGRTDVALTRLEGALARARAIPAAFRDTLAFLIRTEEAAGNVERALLRLDELSEHVYHYAIERAREHVELAALQVPTDTRLEHQQRQARARLVSKVPPPAPPEAWGALDRLAVSAVMRMDPTGRHGKRVGVLVKTLAMQLGDNPLQALEMGLAAELHDIGMMSVPESILAKRGPLNAAERAIMRRHTDAGAEMLRDDRHARVFTAREMAAYHHARWDGEGYPADIGGNRIPFAARACAVAEAYDAMVCGIGSRAPKSMEEALAELRREAGGQFDPRMVECFEELIRNETHEIGLDLASNPSVEDFQELVTALQEDRGFL